MSTKFLTGLGAALVVSLGATVALAGNIQNYSTVTDERLENQEHNNWLQVRGNHEGWLHSRLDQITSSNVGNLQPVWSFATGVIEGHQAPPIVNDGVMFVATPQNQVIALDAVSGKQLWRYKREIPEDLFQLHPTSRGVGLYGDLVYFAASDCFLIALDAKTGEVVWEVAVNDYQAGYYMSLQPFVAHGKVVVGTSGGEYGIRGHINAYDAATGAEIWNTYTIPAPGEPGSDTWPDDDAWKTGGGSAWNTGTYDADTNILYWGIGNAAPWIGETRGFMDNLYTTSVIAMDLDSGNIIGHHQYHWNDSWDWDEVSPPIIRPITYGGRTFKALVNVARNGHIFVLEPTPEGPINFVDAWPYVYGNVVTDIDPKTGRFTYDKAHWPVLNEKVEFCPSLWGGKDWPSAAYNPDTDMIYIPANENICSTLLGIDQEFIQGELYLGVDIPILMNEFFMREGWDHVGEIQAWNVSDKKEVWTHNFEHQNWGPILSTAGNLLFAGGTNDHMFRAFDASNGSVLWEYPTLSGITAPPSTWSVDGTQYVGVVSGWGVDAERKQGVFRTIIPGYDVHVPQGGAIYVFALQ